jgi:hypothetical protein
MTIIITDTTTTTETPTTPKTTTVIPVSYPILEACLG